MSEVTQAKSSLSLFRRLLVFLQPYKSRFVLALIAMVVYGATDGAIPFLIRSVLDDIFGAQDEHILKLLPIALVVFAVVRGGFGFLQRYLAASVGLRIIKDIRNAIHEKLLTLSSAFFSEHSTGSIVSRMTNDTLLVRTALTDSVAALLRDSIRIIALLCAAVYLDPVLALIAFVGFPLAIWPVIRFGKRVRRYSRVGQDKFGGLTSVLQETVIGHRIVQAFAMEKREQEKFEQVNAELTNTFERAEKYGALSAPTNELVASFAIGGVILYGGLSVISGVRTQGDFVAFLTAMFLLYDPIKKLGRINSRIQQGIAAAERIFEVMDTVPTVSDKPGAMPLEEATPHITYDAVSFFYGESRNGENPPWVLSEVSLDIPPGKTLALVGMSGGGKSTIANLLPRFADPTHGKICIGKTDIRDVTLTSLRSHIAVVGQHTFLFNDTVYNNIAYGRPGATREEILEASRAAYAHQFVERLEEGYDTVIGEQGLSLSGGERARLAIARALLKDAPILILDEATAQLDSESEALVQEAIYRLMAGRTVLVIAHRLATIRNADTIAVVVGGKIVERGSHQELLQVGGEYAKLYRIQFRDDQEEGRESRAERL